MLPVVSLDFSKSKKHLFNEVLFFFAKHKPCLFYMPNPRKIHFGV